jgi:hypothetical protein
MHKQHKLQHDAMVYLCLSKVLLMFKHDQSHVMIIRDTHIYKGNNFSFYSSLQFGCYTRAQPRAGTVVPDEFSPRPRVSSSNGRTLVSPEPQLGQASL